MWEGAEPLQAVTRMAGRMGNCAARRRREEDTDYQPDLEDWEDSEEDEDEEQEEGDVEEEKKERKYEDANSKVCRRNLVSESADCGR